RGDQVVKLDAVVGQLVTRAAWQEAAGELDQSDRHCDVHVLAAAFLVNLNLDAAGTFGGCPRSDARSSRWRRWLPVGCECPQEAFCLLDRDLVVRQQVKDS